MLRRSSKKLAIMMILSMLATMFVGVGVASASSTYDKLSTPTVLSGTPGQTLATIQIDIPTLEYKNQSLLVTLPTDFAIEMDSNGNYVNGPKVSCSSAEDNKALINTLLQQSGNGIVPVSAREFKVVITEASMVGTALDPSGDSDVRLLVSLPKVTTSDDEGDITATFTNLAGNFSSGSVVVGVASSSGTITATVVSDVTVTEGSSDQVELNFKENTKMAIANGDTIKLKLPSGLAWSNPVMANLTDSIDPSADFPTGTNGSFNLTEDDRTLTITRKGNAESGKNIYRLTADISVEDEDKAKMGDIVVSISGNNEITTSSLVVGEYAETNATAEVVSDVPTVIPGQFEQDVADFNIVENAAGSVLDNRTVTLELPKGVKWFEVNQPTVSGGMVIGDFKTSGSDGDTIKLNLSKESTSKGKIKFEDVKVMTAVDFTGDITVTISGAGIEESTLVIGKAEPALTAKSAGAANVQIGTQGQETGDITISEAVAETFIEDGELVLELPNGVEWGETPEVEVTEGDVEIGDIDVDDEVLTIDIDNASTVASTIKISGISLDIDRTLATGDIKVKVKGSAIDEVNYSVDDAPGAVKSGNDYQIGTIDSTTGDTYFVEVDPDKGVFPQNKTAASITIAKCVSGVSETTTNDSSFVIGATTYTVNGVEYTMDVAPYISNSRTYMPIRYIANAMGINDDNILWDANTQTVTLLKGTQVVQLKIGSTSIIVNGAPIAMDVAPEITNSRTMLPARYVAQAFGYTVGWDEATQTVTLK